MSRAIPWIIAAVCFVAFGVTFSELHRVRSGLLSRLYHNHVDVRRFMIRAALAEADQPIIFFGDSITEMAPLPSQICGHPVVNAGIGGISIADGSELAPTLLSDKKSVLIVSALGANDIGSSSAESAYGALLRTLSRLSQKVISVSDTSDASINRQIANATAAAETPYLQPQLPPTSKMSDGIHYTRAAYEAWLPAIEDAIGAAIKGCSNTQRPPS